MPAAQAHPAAQLCSRGQHTAARAATPRACMVGVPDRPQSCAACSSHGRNGSTWSTWLRLLSSHTCGSRGAAARWCVCSAMQAPQAHAEGCTGTGREWRSGSTLHLHPAVHTHSQRQRQPHNINNTNRTPETRTSTLSSTITASGMWLAVRPPGPGGGRWPPRPSTAVSVLILLPECSRLWPVGGAAGGGGAAVGERATPGHHAQNTRCTSTNHRRRSSRCE